jgi:hypothetical protein
MRKKNRLKVELQKKKNKMSNMLKLNNQQNWYNNMYVKRTNLYQVQVQVHDEA